MEKYLLKKSKTEVNAKLGHYCRLVNGKHSESYGSESAKETLHRVVNIYNYSQELLAQDYEHNLLLVGKVQSGKTSNLELFTALAFDNGYHMMILYGGYDDTLLSQTNDRFKKTFDIPLTPSLDDSTPAFFSTSSKMDFDALEDSVIQDMVEANKPIIITAMKRPQALRKINAFLENLKIEGLRVFVIDDEGDQASLNTAKDKVNNKSATYLEIVRMKDYLKNPLYLSVTATPHANIFSPDISRLRPTGIRLIDSGDGYCGSWVYHQGDPDLIKNIEDFEDDVDSNRMPESMKYAIKYFIVSSAIMDMLKLSSGGDMIIHSYREVSVHAKICSFVDDYLNEMRTMIKLNQQRDIEQLLKEFENVYKSDIVKPLLTAIDFNKLKPFIIRVIEKVFVFMKNSKGNLNTLPLEPLRKYRIYIGGDLLQRGVTFKNLVVTYFTRWANTGNMDTTLQRARWFGYRSKFIDLCKIFTTNEIQSEFSNLADSEIDLWDQFESVEKGELEISDVVIQAGDTQLRPTRKNVATYDKIEFARRWTKQQLGFFDKNTLQQNNEIVNKFLSSHKFRNANLGRHDSEKSCAIASVRSVDVINFLAQLKSIFTLPPFNLSEYLLKDLFSKQESVPVIMMDGIRERKFLDNKVNNIHQGPDKAEKSERKYDGDTEVIADKSIINIQMHYIVPKRSGVATPELGQFMFAIFVPGKQSYYIRGEAE